MFAKALYLNFEEDLETSCCFLLFQLTRLVSGYKLKVLNELFVVGKEPQSDSVKLVMLRLEFFIK